MPSPHKKSFAADQLARQKKKNPWPWVVVAVLAVVIVAGVLFTLHARYKIEVKPVTEETVSVQEQVKSIAVLPFRDMSREKDQDWFCEGLSEGIISALSNVSDLQVTGSTSAFAFKNKELGIPEIGKQLKVEAVLEGSILKSGSRILITAQLIKVSDGFHFWSQEYDRELKDVIDMRAEISMKIVEALKVKLLDKEKAAIEKRHTENTEAYNLYLLGRYHWNKRTDEGLDRALDYFRQATDTDPNYALAYSGIADVFILKGFYGFLSPRDAFPKAKAADEKALLLDTTIAEAHTSLAFINLCYDWDWAAAESEFKKALELNPNYANTYHWYSQYLLVMGRVDDAIIAIQRARELDPLSLQINVAAGSVFVFARKYDEAIEQLHTTLEMDPNHPTTYWMLGGCYYNKAMWKEAIEAYQKFVKLSGGSPFALSCLGSAYAASGHKDKALQILDILDELSKKRYVSPWQRATVYIALGEMDKAFEYLEKSYEERNLGLIYLKVSPDFDPIRSDPRYKILLKKMNLSVE